MKRMFFAIILLLAVSACKKTKFAPEGPTDVRVRNMQETEIFTDIVINTAGVRDTVGNLKHFEVSVYKRVKIAFSKAEITAKINGETFSTGPVNSTYMDYKGQMKITYEVYISNMTNKVLAISNVIINKTVKI